MHLVRCPGVKNVQYVAILLLREAPLHTVGNVSLRLIYGQVSITPGIEALPIRIEVLCSFGAIPLRLLVVGLTESLKWRPLRPILIVVSKRNV